jgi:carbon monoxide dehydrogenase subunit G
MQRFEGDRNFSLPPTALWAKLTDCRFLVGCIPDVETVSHQEPDRATLVLRPGFAFVRGTLDLEMNVVERQEPTSARLVLNSKGIGSSSEVEASLAIAAIENGSRLHWIAEVKSLGGLLKMVPGGLIRGAAQKVIGDALDAIGGKLEGAKT